MRVNLEVGKSFYAWCIKKDKKIDGTYMRSTTIPEEMGRVSYLLADKTGTVTKNEMSFKKITLADTCYEENNFHEVYLFFRIQICYIALVFIVVFHRWKRY